MADQGFSPEIQARIDALPPAAREFVMGQELGNIVQLIGSKNQLHIDQIGELEAEVMAAMIGITEPEEFEENVAGALGVDEQKASALAKDVNDLIFLKVRDGMKASTEPKKEPLASQIPLAAQAQPVVPTPVVPEPKPMPVSTPASVAPTPVPTPTPAPMPAPVPVPMSVPTTPTPAAPAVVPPSAPKPAPAADVASADAILSEKKVVVAPAAPISAVAETSKPQTPSINATPAAPADIKPQNYKADPYREPVE